MNQVIKEKMDDLRLQGVLTGEETDEELAEIAGMSSKYSTENIVDKLAGRVDELLGSAMTALALIAAAGALIAKLKNADILGKLKGFGKKVAALPKLATDTISGAISDVDDGADSIVGSARIPSIKEAAGPLPENLATSDISSGIVDKIPTGGYTV